MDIKQNYLDCTFHKEDVSVLLNELSDGIMPDFLKKKETLPDKKIIKHFFTLVENTLEDIVNAINTATDMALNRFGDDIMLISLLRGGLHAGIGIKHAIKYKRGIEVPHYAVSLIKRTGLDFAAIDFIYDSHPNKIPLFVDGWTGKGDLYNELCFECKRYYESKGVFIPPNLAVVVNVFGNTPVYGTTKEIFMPESLLASNISGLIGRSGFVDPKQFHFTRMYREFLPIDLTQYYVNRIKQGLTSIKGCGDNILFEEPPKSYSDLKTYLKREYSLEFDKSYLGSSECSRAMSRKKISELIIRDKGEYYAPPLLYIAEQKEIKITVDQRLPIFSVCR